MDSDRHCERDSLTLAKTRRRTRPTVSSLPRRAARGGSCGTTGAPLYPRLPADSGCAQRRRAEKRPPAPPVTLAARRCPSCRPRRPDVAGARQWARAAPPDNFQTHTAGGGGRPSLRAAPPLSYPVPSRISALSFLVFFFLLFLHLHWPRCSASSLSLYPGSPSASAGAGRGSSRGRWNPSCGACFRCSVGSGGDHQRWARGAGGGRSVGL